MPGMTTIALKDGLMAADYLVGEDFAGYRKIQRIRKGRWAGGWAGICGHFYPAMALLAEIQKPEMERRAEDDETTLLVVPPGSGKPFAITWEVTPVPLPPGPYAVGTGSQAAMAAMLEGASAQRAVELACRLDPASSLCGRRKPQVVRVRG
jgi:hypothetical protein